MSTTEALTAARKADRAEMARQVADLAGEYGLKADLYPEEAGSRRASVDLGCITSGLRVCVKFDGRGTKADGPDVFVLNWYGVKDGWRLAPFKFGPRVNPFHGHKATDVAHGFDDLLCLLGRRFAVIRDGSAFVAMRPGGHFDPAGALALYRTLPETEIRRRQDMCAEQTRRAYDARSTRALADLQAMADALTAAMLERC